MSGSTKEAMDLLDLVGNGNASRRRASVPKAGSVWETRMKLDQVHGGIKVFHATATPTPPHPHPPPASSPPPPPQPQVDDDSKLNNNTTNSSSKRKTWKSDNSEGTPVPILHSIRQRSESSKNSSHQFKEISVSADEIMKKSRSDGENDTSATPQQLSEQHQQGRNSDSLDRNPLDQLVTDLDKKVIDNPIKPRSDDQRCEDKKPISTNVGRRINTPSDGGEEQDKDRKQIEIEKITPQQQRPEKFGAVEEKKPTPGNRSRFHPIPTKAKPNNNSDGIPKSSGKLQAFVDLVMWRDVSKSAFVFGIGTFAIVSSSFTKDLNISFISVVSYLGLVYLAANFLFRSLITRGSVEMPEYVVGEEEAIWVMKLILPCVNEFLVKLRALFSGDPATTMKLAVLLFILAQCGSSITIWKMAKLGFFAVFTVPKISSSYSSHISAYGTFWIHRFMDAWDSCSHKKLVGFVVFTLVWNLASLVARMWIVFMSFVALKYYQQSSMISQGCTSEETSSTRNSSWQQGQHIGGRQRIGSRSPSSAAVTRTQKKAC